MKSSFADPLVVVGGAIVTVAALLWCLPSRPTEYDLRVEQASVLTPPWDRYQALTVDKSPNAWAMVFPNESDDHARWAELALVELKSALAAHDPRAVEYVCTKYGAYRSLDSLHQQFCSAGMS